MIMIKGCEKMYDVILFDLDGTLTDPGVGITNSVAYALESYGIKTEDKKSLYSFIGPPLKDSFMKYYGFSENQAIDAIKVYREYFSDKGIFENQVYDGIKELLEKLHLAGNKIVLATSKPEQFAVRILEHFDLIKYFTLVAGASMDEKRNKKGDVISYALKKGGFEKEKAIMIGDREHDIIGAKKNGLPSIGVLYGYGSEDELKNAGATHIAKTVEDILSFI